MPPAQDLAVYPVVHSIRMSSIWMECTPTTARQDRRGNFRAQESSWSRLAGRRRNYRASGSNNDMRAAEALGSAARFGRLSGPGELNFGAS